MQARLYKAWTEADNATLGRMTAAGDKTPAIARALERSQESVRSHIAVLKLAKHP